MRSSPFSSLRATARVFVKAVALLAVLNLVLLAAGIDPTVAIMRLNTWPLIGKSGTPRLTVPNLYVRGQMPLGALIAAHEIAFEQKAPDEFRVIVLGDSAQYGAGLNDQETFTAQLTARPLIIHGKRLVAYNLAYPGPYAPRDLLILDSVMRFHPDLIIWFVTASGLTSVKNGANLDTQTFFRLNQPQVDRLLSQYGQEWLYKLLLPKPPWYPLSAIRDQDAIPVWLDSLILPFVAYTLVRFGPYPDEQRIGKAPLPEHAVLDINFPGLDVMPNETWQFLLIGKSMAENAGAQLLLINEPIFAGSGPHSDVNYNPMYTRRLYDKYRDVLATFASDHTLWYADLWDAIPPERFTDTPFHADAEGWRQVTAKVALIIQDKYQVVTH